MPHECEYEETILKQSRKIERLEARVDFKHERMTEVNEKIDKLTEKIDDLVKTMNSLTLKSTNDDHILDGRLKAIETELELQKEVTEDQRGKTNQYMTCIVIFFTALTFYFQFMR